MIKWGIIGYGRMGKQFDNCFYNSNSQYKLLGVASNSNSKVQEKKRDDNFYSFKSYEDLINSNDINAIYISTLNNTHKELVISALENNKKVLCEKPLGMNFSEVKNINEKIKDKKNLIEAIAYRSHPQTKVIIKLLNEKEFGNVKKIESYFGFKIRRFKRSSRLFNKSFGGGSILDLGCYPISFFNLFKKGANTIKILNSKFTLCDTNVDVEGEINLKINDEIDAFGKVCLNKKLDNICRIYLENAIITIPSPWLPPEKTFLEIETKSRYFKKFVQTDKNVYEHQLDEVSSLFNSVGASNSLLVDIEESLEISRITSDWLK